MNINLTSKQDIISDSKTAKAIFDFKDVFFIHDSNGLNPTSELPPAIKHILKKMKESNVKI